MISRPVIEYRTWETMRWRCSPRNRFSKRYYDRGIRVCPRWGSFENFYADMGIKPTPKHTLDRTDNDKGYSPGNCRWATYREQANNTSRTNTVLVGDKRVTLMELARSSGIHPETLRARIKNGWPYEKLLRNPDEYKRGLHRNVTTI